MKILKKAQIAGAVMLATAGVAMSTAQADSLLAPLIIDTSGANSLPYSAGNVRTFLNIKVKGANGPTVLGNPQDRLHYVWIRKGATVASLFNRAGTCTMVNNEGRVTRNDMVFQQTRGPATASGSALNNVTPDGAVFVDNSRPNTHGNNDFVGMLVVTDLANESNAGSGTPEGDMSGFAYIVQAGATGDVVEYKLLNNHHSAEDGNFSAGFTSKKVVDFAWMRNPASAVRTGWTVMVTGPDMSKHTGAFNSTYDATVLLSQKTHADGTQDDPTTIIGGSAGVINNDEGYTSYDPALPVTCMASFVRANLLGNDPLLLANTASGGWMRMSIQPANRSHPITGVPITPNHAASGAVVYRDDVINGHHTMQMETSGHLAIGANHANRPY